MADGLGPPTDPTGGMGGMSQAIPTTGTPPMLGQGGVPNAAIPGRGPNPIMTFLGGQRVQPSAGGPGDMANAMNHVNLAMAALERALAGMNKNDKNYAQLAGILHKLSRVLPQGGTAPAMGPLQTLLGSIQQALRQRQFTYSQMAGAGGPAQQMARAAQPAMNLGAPPPMGAYPGA